MEEDSNRLSGFTVLTKTLEDEIQDNVFQNLRTISVRYEPLTYKVKYFLVDPAVKLSGEAITEYQYGEAKSLPVASKAGYTFLGWCTNKDLGGKAIMKITEIDSGDKYLYPKFIRN